MIGLKPEVPTSYVMLVNCFIQAAIIYDVITYLGANGKTDLASDYSKDLIITSIVEIYHWLKLTISKDWPVTVRLKKFIISFNDTIFLCSSMYLFDRAR